MLASYFIASLTVPSMHTSFLQILQFLGNNGYYARTDAERSLLEELVAKDLVKIKRGTKSVYQLTPEGKNFLLRELNPNTSISDEEFLSSLRNAYNDLANPMKPLVRIPDVRKKLNEKRIPDSIFNQKLLELHDQGILTLQTALSKNYAAYGGIESDSGTGVFYYMMFEA
jgi:DNA-binding PadR family transcriptional regulator